MGFIAVGRKLFRGLCSCGGLTFFIFRFFYAVVVAIGSGTFCFVFYVLALKKPLRVESCSLIRGLRLGRNQWRGLQDRNR